VLEAEEGAAWDLACQVNIAFNSTNLVGDILTKSVTKHSWQQSCNC
jgi:hypothetical protein